MGGNPRIPTHFSADCFVCSQFAQCVDQSGFLRGIRIHLLDDFGRHAGNHGIGRNIPDDDGTGGNYGVCSDVAALDHHGIGADEHIVFDDYRCGAGRFNDAGQYGTRTDMGSACPR